MAKLLDRRRKLQAGAGAAASTAMAVNAVAADEGNKLSLTDIWGLLRP